MAMQYHNLWNPIIHQLELDCNSYSWKIQFEMIPSEMHSHPSTSVHDRFLFVWNGRISHWYINSTRKMWMNNDEIDFTFVIISHKWWRLHRFHSTPHSIINWEIGFFEKVQRATTLNTSIFNFRLFRKIFSILYSNAHSRHREESSCPKFEGDLMSLVKCDDKI